MIFPNLPLILQKISLCRKTRIAIPSHSTHSRGVRSFALILFGSSLAVSAQLDDLTLGVETLTGLRSNYLWRGFDLADTTLEAQLETEITLADDWYLGFAAWHLAESSSDFSQTAANLSLTHSWENLSLTAALEYRDHSGGILEDGLEASLQAFYQLSEDWDVSLLVAYDEAAEGFYSELEFGWSRPLNKKTFLALEVGASVTNDYYDASGLNDLHARLSLTYNVSSVVSITPFLALNEDLQDRENDRGDNLASLGVWLEVSF